MTTSRSTTSGPRLEFVVAALKRTRILDKYSETFMLMMMTDARPATARQELRKRELECERCTDWRAIHQRVCRTFHAPTNPDANYKTTVEENVGASLGRRSQFIGRAG